VVVVDHGDNKGYSVAKNTGVEASTGDLITLLDADDMLTENSLTIRANYLKGHSEMGVHGAAYVIRGDDGAAYYKAREYKLGIGMRKDKIHAQTFMLRREVYKMYGLYDENLRSRSDNEFNRRLIDVAGLTFKRIVPQPIDERHWEFVLAYYRKHERSMVVYRKAHKDYNNEVTRVLEDAKAMRLREGITRENTKFLEA
jgi:glycosyltransferase involved in cell wall biosynthesis